MSEVTARQRQEVEHLLLDGRFAQEQVRQVLSLANFGTVIDVRSLPTLPNLLHHTVIRDFVDSEMDADTQLDETTTEETKTRPEKQRRKGKTKWSDAALHKYWMEILRGAYQLTVRRYTCALRIAKLVIPDSDDTTDKVERRAKLLQSLVLVPRPGGVLHRRTPLHHRDAGGFRRDAMERMKLTSISIDPEFNDKYNEEYFIHAVALSRKLDTELQWLRRSIVNPSCDVMF